MSDYNVNDSILGDFGATTSQQSTTQFQSTTDGVSKPASDIGAAKLFCNMISTSLDNAGEEHRTRVADIINKANAKIKQVILPHPYGGTLFVLGNLGFLTVYSTTMSRPDNPEINPLSSSLKVIKEYAKTQYRTKEGKDVNIIGDTMIVPEDYPQAVQMANAIILILTQNQPDSEEKILLKDLTGSHFRITNNQTIINDFLQRYSPHGIRAHSVVYFGVEIFINSTWQMIMAIGCYTEVRQAPMSGGFGGMGYNHMNMSRLTPFIHVPCDFVSIAMFPEIMTFVIPLIFQEFVMNRRWVDQFRGFTEGDPNLGILFEPDPTTNQPQLIMSDHHLNVVLEQSFDTGFIFFDYTYGRMNIPGFKQMTKMSKGDKILGQIFADFLDMPVLADVSYFGKPWSEIIGTIPQDGRILDTRAIDVFYMSKHLQGEQLNQFRYRGGFQEFDRLNSIREVFRNLSGQIDARYRNIICPIAGTGIDALNIAMSNKINLVATERFVMNQFTATDYNNLAATYHQVTPPTFNMISYQTNRPTYYR